MKDSPGLGFTLSTFYYRIGSDIYALERLHNGTHSAYGLFSGWNISREEADGGLRLSFQRGMEGVGAGEGPETQPKQKAQFS